jgi:hypothetical protein
LMFFAPSFPFFSSQTIPILPSQHPCPSTTTLFYPPFGLYFINVPSCANTIRNKKKKQNNNNLAPT